MWTRVKALRLLANQAKLQNRLTVVNLPPPQASSFPSALLSSSSSSSSEPSSSSASGHVSPSDKSKPAAKSYAEGRLESLATHELYPHKFHVTASLDHVLQTYQHLAAGQEATAEDNLSLAGLVRSVRSAGRQLRLGEAVH